MGKILGVNKRYLPQDNHERNIPLTVVLVEGDVGDYAAYAGLTENIDFVKAYGDKISFKEACCHFPGGQLDEKRYRI